MKLSPVVPKRSSGKNQVDTVKKKTAQSSEICHCLSHHQGLSQAIHLDKTAFSTIQPPLVIFSCKHHAAVSYNEQVELMTET